MSDIVYCSPKVQAAIDSFEANITERINVELVAMQLDMSNASYDKEDIIDDGAIKYSNNQHKPMSQTIGKHARQLTIKSKDSYRVIYVVKFADAIYVLHAFKKKTEGTAKKEYTTAKQRYKQLEQYRKAQGLK
jgi:phage-related protein